MHGCMDTHTHTHKYITNYFFTIGWVKKQRATVGLRVGYSEFNCWKQFFRETCRAELLQVVNELLKPIWKLATYSTHNAL